MFKITLNTANAAFEDKAAETARILRDIAQRVAEGDQHGNVRDINGNTIGSWSF